MAIQSMTGFARATGLAAGRSFAWEIRAVNGRSHDIKLRTPPGFDSVGEEARKSLATKVNRGSIQINLQVATAASASDAMRSVRINAELLATLAHAVAAVPVPVGMGGATLDALLGLRGVVEQVEEDPLAQLEAMKKTLLGAFAVAETDFLVSRSNEGEALASVLSGQLDQISLFTKAITDHPARSADAIRARLGAQIALLLEGANKLDPDRLHQEAAILATKADVREELDRLEAHVASARDMLGAGGAVGRRLDFLAQEFGREASTLCAKANDATLSRIGLDLRAVVDQWREQVQNVE